MFTLSKVIKVAPLSLIATLCFAASGAHAQSADLRVDPVPPEGETPYFGAQTAVNGRTAVVATPGDFKFDDGPGGDGSLIFSGTVHIWTTDINRTAWSLQTTLHAEDASLANQGFGVALALDGRQLVIATFATLRFYEKTAQGFVLRDVVSLAGEHVALSPPIDFANGVLAIRTTLDSGDTVVRLFHVNARGKARSLGLLQVEARSLSLDADGGALAIGISSNTAGGRVFFYQRQGDNWVLDDTLEQPTPEAVGFGASVALHGRRLLAGAPFEAPPPDPSATDEPYSGAVYAYHRQNGQWLQVQRVGATDDPTQAAFGLHRFGAKIATHGRNVLVSAPFNGDFSIGSMPTGPTTLFQWDASGLHSGRQALTSSDLGGIDVSGRYVIAGTPGFWFGGYFDGAWVEDFADIDPGFSAEASNSDEETADDGD